MNITRSTSPSLAQVCPFCELMFALAPTIHEPLHNRVKGRERCHVILFNRQQATGLYINNGRVGGGRVARQFLMRSRRGTPTAITVY